MSGREYVYAFINRSSKKPDYIGRAKSAERLADRIREHTSDDWYSHDDYDITIISVTSRASSELLEGEAIALWQPKYNRDKKNWGTLGLPKGVADPINWGKLPDTVKSNYTALAYALKGNEEYMRRQSHEVEVN